MKTVLPPDFEPISPRGAEEIPFAVRALPAIGSIILVLSVLVGLVLFSVGSRLFGESGILSLLVIAVIIAYGIVVCGVLQAVELAVRLLQKIASSLDR